jgi:predicted RNase H-like HicB family nuclease
VANACTLSLSFAKVIRVFPVGLDILHAWCWNDCMMDPQTTVELAGYRLPVVAERVDDSFQATSPALPGFLVLANTLDEVLSLAPGVARALLEAMQPQGVALPLRVEEVHFPTQIDVKTVRPWFQPSALVRSRDCSYLIENRAVRHKHASLRMPSCSLRKEAPRCRDRMVMACCGSLVPEPVF